MSRGAAWPRRCTTRRYDHDVRRAIDLPATAVIVTGVWLYRALLGWAMGGACRFHPTCSQYMLDAVAKYGPWRGGWRGVKRICRCHPWGGSGHDPA